MARGIFDSPLWGIANKGMVGLINAPIIGRFVRRRLIEVRYVGGRSGKTFQIPVRYRHSGDDIVIDVTASDSKNWWRNFLGDGGPIILLNFDGQDRNGHAVANRYARGRVSVTVRFDE